MGLVESRSQLLICALETLYVHAWPFARFFERKYNSAGVYIGSGVAEEESSSETEDCLHERCFFIGLQFAPEIDTIGRKMGM
jgi:hypothetical protein